MHTLKNILKFCVIAHHINAATPSTEMAETHPINQTGVLTCSAIKPNFPVLCAEELKQPRWFKQELGVFYVDLCEYPSSDVYQDERFHRPLEITLPDLHGNALKLLHTLISANILFLNEEYYKKFVSIYFKKAEDITAEDLSTFNQILEEILPGANSRTVVRFIGDILSDRGSNDFWTIHFLNQLNILQIPYEIIFSNHDFDFFINQYGFLKGFVETFVFNFPGFDLPEHNNSSLSLKTLMQKKLVSQREIAEMLQSAYLPYVKLLSISHGFNSMAIYTHAPAGMKTIKELANYFHIEYRDHTVDELTNTINQINHLFLCTDWSKRSIDNIQPIQTFLWNRDGACYKDIPDQLYGGELYFVHGHTPSIEGEPSNVYNLDTQNDLGKLTHPFFNSGELYLLISKSHKACRAKGIFRQAD
ncbi:MAG: hypothetical protein HEEMFOPI_00752 [Holosporales bacterium]